MSAIAGASNTVVKIVGFINCLWSNQPISRALGGRSSLNPKKLSTSRPPGRVARAYGFGGIYSGGASEAELRRYLAQPLTIFLGQEDTGDEDRNDSAQAVAQGETRYQRGRNA